MRSGLLSRGVSDPRLVAPSFIFSVPAFSPRGGSVPDVRDSDLRELYSPLVYPSRSQ